MLIPWHKILKHHIATRLPALACGDEIGAGRVGVVTDVDVESQIGDLARILGAAVAYFVGEPQFGCVDRINGRGISPGFVVRKRLTVSDRMFLVLCVSKRPRTTIGASLTYSSFRLPYWRYDRINFLIADSRLVIYIILSLS